MSYVGEQIRAQERVARRLHAEMDDDVRSLRHRVGTTQWQSSAGDAFRHVLEDFLRELEACRTEVEELAGDLNKHAACVDANAKAMGDVLAWPAHRVKDGAEWAADSIHDGFSAVGRSWQGLTHIGSER